ECGWCALALGGPGGSTLSVRFLVMSLEGWGRLRRPCVASREHSTALLFEADEGYPAFPIRPGGPGLLAGIAEERVRPAGLRTLRQPRGGLFETIPHRPRRQRRPLRDSGELLGRDYHPAFGLRRDRLHALHEGVVVVRHVLRRFRLA